MKLWKIVLTVWMLLGAVAAQAAPDPQNVLIMELPWGNVSIEMLPDLAPKHVARIKELVRAGFYDGTPFHRVIDGFMAQGGDPTGTGTGGSGFKIAAELTGSRFVRGTVGMARGASYNSADSQFFIMYGAAPALDGRYTVWGQVLEGMENVDKITKGHADMNGVVDRPDRIVHMSIAGDKK